MYNVGICQSNPNPCEEPDFSNQTSLTCANFTKCSTYSQIPAVGSPYIYEGECTIGINRYLSRAADVGSLANLNYNNDGGNTYCNSVDGSWDLRYCPQQYCELIKSMVELDIQMIQRAYTGASYHEHQFFEGEDWYELGAKIVRDINHALIVNLLRLPRWSTRSAG